MLAARDRAAGSSARAAILRGDVAATGESAGAGGAAVATPAPSASGGASPRKAREAAPTATPTAPPVAQPVAPAPAPIPYDSGDTIARLREAKRRARGGCLAAKAPPGARW
jgi:hypothetical protein